MSLHQPGTVSKILWHFTGGPLLDSRNNGYSVNRKPESDAFNILTKILKSRELKVGSFREMITVGGKTLQTRKVCCVADIPIGHLGFHSRKYGKIAIGFRRNSLIRARFNPVFYVTEDKPAVTRFHDALEALQSFIVSAEPFRALAIGNLFEDSEIDRKTGEALISALDGIKDRAAKASDNLKVMQSFIKTLNDEDFDSIFCEREWRNDSPFRFNYSDIAMIVLPENSSDGKNLYKKFVSDHVSDLGLPREIPVISWEDLIEH